MPRFEPGAACDEKLETYLGVMQTPNILVRDEGTVIKKPRT